MNEKNFFSIEFYAGQYGMGDTRGFFVTVEVSDSFWEKKLGFDG